MAISRWLDDMGYSIKEYSDVRHELKKKMFLILQGDYSYLKELYELDFPFILEFRYSPEECLDTKILDAKEHNFEIYVKINEKFINVNKVETIIDLEKM